MPWKDFDTYVNLAEFAESDGLEEGSYTVAYQAMDNRFTDYEDYVPWNAAEVDAMHLAYLKGDPESSDDESIYISSHPTTSNPTALRSHK